VAANGQYILVRRVIYEELGGHATIANKILEDIELARIFKAFGAYAHYGDLGGHLFLELDQRRHLFNAGFAPTRPEIQDHGFSAQVMESDGMIGVAKGEVRGRAADHPDPGCIVTATQHERQQCQNHDAQGFHTLIIT
jgi:hypothetical protein